MELRKEIEPKLDVAEKLYPKVLELILLYSDYCDENGDEDFVEYKKLEEKLYKLTAKSMSGYNLWEWWEEEGAEVLAFRISLPAPQEIENISKDELLEVVKRLSMVCEVLDKHQACDFQSQFRYFLNDYYHQFLKINFKKYSYSYFNRQKDKNGNYFEYSNEEKVGKIWTEKS